MVSRLVLALATVGGVFHNLGSVATPTCDSHFNTCTLATKDFMVNDCVSHSEPLAATSVKWCDIYGVNGAPIFECTADGNPCTWFEWEDNAQCSSDLGKEETESITAYTAPRPGRISHAVEKGRTPSTILNIA
ncbi:hypothetical protein ACCO45_013943 [Purpureocillium lilacinum]|uniref:Uncharacterized protein n=1 Tax=Purpureocillium lilacinum TaxID=33203 RepID=A0ACC4D9P6_PURLI